MKRLTVGVVGASGYVGAELVRWIVGHSELRLSAVTSRSHEGKAFSDVFPALLGCVELAFEAFDAGRLAALDVVFVAVPHGSAASLVAQLDACGAKAIFDCSSDHRLLGCDADSSWVYGLAEWQSEALAGATRVAVPGCFATAQCMAIAPLANAGAIDGPVMVAAATGSTGSGASAKSATHHPERFCNIKAYKVLSHQHEAEIKAFSKGLGQAIDLCFVPLSAPVDRGIFATCFVPLKSGIDARSLFADAYGDSALVRLREDTPQLRHVRGTAFCDLTVTQQGDTAVVLVAIDNLGKGAASQALQAMNLSFRFPSEAGLKGPPCLP